MTLTAIGYCRCSTREQSRDGASIDAQRAQLHEWAEREGVPLGEVFVDAAVSGGAALEKRTGLLQALESVAPDSVFAVARRDRLARDAFAAAWIEKEVRRRGGAIVSISDGATNGDDPTSILLRRIIDAFSEFERSLIRSRTKAALAHRRSLGKRIGRIPYGYRLGPDNTTVEDPDEQAVIERICSLRSSGMTLVKIADTLTEDGVPTKCGQSGKWRFQTVSKILRRVNGSCQAARNT